MSQTINDIAETAPRYALPDVTAKRKRVTARSAAGVSERARQAIQTGQLVGLLHRIANGEKKVEPHQVTAAIALLRKVLPDLQATMVSGDPQLPITIITRLE